MDLPWRTNLHRAVAPLHRIADSCQLRNLQVMQGTLSPLGTYQVYCYCMFISQRGQGSFLTRRFLCELAAKNLNAEQRQ